MARALRLIVAVGKPVLGVFMSSGSLPDLATSNGARIPGYHTPEPAAIALAHAVRYAEWRARPLEGPPVLPGIQRDEAGLMLADALRRGAGWLAPEDVRRLLSTIWRAHGHATLRGYSVGGCRRD